MNNKISGIYSITNTISRKVYYGSSVNCRSRWSNHKRHLLLNKHYNSHLQHSWNKYGKDAFIFKIEEEVPKEQLQQIEQQYLDWCKVVPEWSYNMGYDAIASMRGRKMSDETKKKLSIIRTGIKFSKEHRKHLSEAGRGRKHIPFSKETRRKLSQSLKGINVWSKGRKLSEKHKKRISKANKGKMIGEKNPAYGKPSPFLGKTHSEETKQKIRRLRLENPSLRNKLGQFCKT